MTQPTDTQAPDDRALWQEISTHAPDRVSILWGDLANRHQDFDDDTARVTHLGQFVFGTEYVKASVASARAAAAREAAWKSGYMIGARCADRAEYDAAYARYCADFPGAPDAQAALDALIANARREAVEDICDQLMRRAVHPDHAGAIIEAVEFIRASKEGR